VIYPRSNPPPGLRGEGGEEMKVEKINNAKMAETGGVMKLTADVLRKMEACPEAITFLARNYPDGIDLSRYEIRGEYRGWVVWLRDKQSAQYEYDKRGNLVRKTYPEGKVRKWRYDPEAIYENGKKICWLKEKNA